MDVYNPDYPSLMLIIQQIHLVANNPAIPSWMPINPANSFGYQSIQLSHLYAKTLANPFG